MTIQSLCHHATSILCLAGIAVAACTAPADPGAIGGDDSGDSSGSSGSSSDDSGDDESSGGLASASDATGGTSGGDSSGGDSSSGEGPSPEPEPEPQPGCVPTGNEWCNGLDDDCDDAVDEICPTDGALVTLSNEYMGGFYGLSAAGTSSPPQMADFDVAGDRARWIVRDLGDGYFRFDNVYYLEHSLDSSTEAPSLGETAPYSGQFWRPIEIDDSCTLMTNMYLGEMRSLSNVLDSLQVVMGDDSGWPGQCWTIYPLG